MFDYIKLLKIKDKCYINDICNIIYRYYSPFYDRNLSINIDRYYIMDDISINFKQTILYHGLLKKILLIETKIRSKDRITGETFDKNGCYYDYYNLYFCGTLMFFCGNLDGYSIVLDYIKIEKNI